MGTGENHSPIPSHSISDWDRPFTEEELEAIEAALRSATSSSSSSSLSFPTKKRQVGKTNNGCGEVDRPVSRRRLPDSILGYRQQISVPCDSCEGSSPMQIPNSPSLMPCPRNQGKLMLTYPTMNFGGQIVYSRTYKEVEKSANELLKFIESRRKEVGQVILGFDIEWRPSFRRGVLPGKAAVMQICGAISHCHVMHVIHSGIPHSLKSLLEDLTSLKVGVCIANDALKVSNDHNVSITALEDLSTLANKKLGGYSKKWSLASLAERIICKQLPKPNNIRLGNWEAGVLSKEQLHYAATDAFASWYLYEVLKNFPDATDRRREGLKDAVQ